MYWNYRVLKQVNKQGESFFEVCEVGYDENNVPSNWTESHNILIGDTLNELKESYNYISKAFEMPVLEVVENDKLVEMEE